jgi:hypothetical protein
MSLPDLTIGILTYKRPWYASICIKSYVEHLHYGGDIHWLISDGGSDESDFIEYLPLLDGKQASILQSTNYSRMVNAIAKHAGMVWVLSVDDYMLNYDINITKDVRMLMEHHDIGMIRYGQLKHWGSHDADPQTSADLIKYDGELWWKLSKERTKDPYMCNIGFHLYHRRFWDHYGDIPDCPANDPGQGELNSRARFSARADGPTVAVPFRFSTGNEPLQHFGLWHSDEYSTIAGKRMTS